MRVEEALQREMASQLSNQIMDLAAYIKSVRGKKAREELKSFARQMQEGDELWEYEWAGKVGPRDCHETGWCLVRDKQVVARHCAYSS